MIKGRIKNLLKVVLEIADKAMTFSMFSSRLN